MDITLRNVNLSDTVTTSDKLMVMAGVRSPILDLETVNFPDEINKNQEAFEYIMENTWALTLIVRPFLYQHLTELVTGNKVKFDGYNDYDDVQTKPWPALRMINLEQQESLISTNNAMKNSSDSTRVKKTKTHWKLSLNLGTIDLVHDHISNFRNGLKLTTDSNYVQVDISAGSDMHQRELNQTNQYKASILERLVKLLGKKNILTLERGFEVALAPAKVFENTPACNTDLLSKAYETIYDDPEYAETMPEVFDLVLAGIKSVRIIATPTSNRQGLTVYGNKQDSEGKYAVVKTSDEALAIEKTDKELFDKWCMAVLSARTFEIFVDLDLDNEYAKAMMQTQDFDSITGVDLLDWTSQWFHYQDSGNNTWQMRRLKDIDANNQSLAKSGVKPKERTNKEGLTMHPDGYMLYLPSSSTVDKYESTLSENVDTETGELTYDNPKYKYTNVHESVLDEKEVEKRRSKSLPANHLLLVDWFNNKLAYTNTVGSQAILDLERCTPVRPTHVLRVLNSIIYGSEVSETTLSFINTVLAQATHLGLNATAVFTKALSESEAADYKLLVSEHEIANFEDGLKKDITLSLSILALSLSRGARGWISGLPVEDFEKKFAWYVESDYKFRVHDLSPKNGYPILRAIGEVVRQAGIRVLESKVIEETNMSVINKLQMMAFASIFKDYVNEYGKIAKQDEDDRQSFTAPKVQGKNYKPNIPLVAEGIAFQPHQARLDDSLSTSPRFAIIESQAGGGKTIQILSNVLFELQRGEIKRPLILCPSYLVKDYIKEANFLTAGRLNVIAITGESVASWGEEKLVALVENAPINTVVVSDYDFMKNRLVKTMYGTTELVISLNCELLRLLDRDGAWLDESHWLRKVNQRSVSAGRLLAEIPFIREATGTFVVDQMTDVVNQVAVFDPTIFGSMNEFLNTFARDVRGEKVISWKPGAESKVNEVIARNCMVLRAQRKEWAALLPPRKEQMHFVKLSKAQRMIYDAIVAETIEQIKQNDPNLWDLMNQRSEADEETQSSLEALLSPYLARLEQFLTSPATDKASAALMPDDRGSPKAKEIANIIREHIDKKIPGKILIFTSYVASAETIYNELPPDLRELAILYKAEGKFKYAEQFENDAGKLIMVGVEQSLNTGLNFQFASRLIRVESIWSPGLLEQGESRINRPNVKVTEFRDNVFFDWVLVDESIDVTKTGRLIAKMVSMVKYENPYTVAYQQIPDVPLITMNLDSLRANNSFETELSDHIRAFGKMRTVQEAEFEEYRTDPNIDKTSKPIPANKPLPGSKLLSRVPYVSGMDLFGAADLGLVKFNEYIRSNSSAELDPSGLLIHTEWGEGVVTKGYKDSLRVKLNNGSSVSVRKLAAFVISRTDVSTKQIRLQLSKLAGLTQATVEELSDSVEGTEVESPDIEFTCSLVKTVDVWNVYLITDPEYGEYYHIANTTLDEKAKPASKKAIVYEVYQDTESKGSPWTWWNLKNEDDTDSGFKSYQLAEDDLLSRLVVNKKAKDSIKKHPPLPSKTRIDEPGVEMYLGVFNGSYVLTAESKDPDVITARLKKYGFIPWTEAYYYMEIQTGKQLRTLIDKLVDKYTVPTEYVADLEATYELFASGKKNLLRPDSATRAEFRNFYIDKRKRSKDPKTIKPYPVITCWDGVTPECYIMVDALQPASATLKSKATVTGTRWIKEVGGWIAAYCNTKADVKDLVKRIVSDGVNVTNLDEVKETYNAMKAFNRK